LQPDLRQRDRPGLRDARLAVPQYRLGQEWCRLHGLPQPRRDAQHAVPQLGALPRQQRLRAGARLAVTRAAPRGLPARHAGRAGAERPVARLQRRRRCVPAVRARALGYSVGAVAYRLSPHAIAFPERLGPLVSAQHAAEPDRYLAGVFKRPESAEPMNAPKHDGYRQVLATRTEVLSACPDLTDEHD